MDFKPDTFHEALSSVYHSMQNDTKFLDGVESEHNTGHTLNIYLPLTLTRTQKPVRAVIHPQHLALEASAFSILS